MRTKNLMIASFVILMACATITPKPSPEYQTLLKDIDSLIVRISTTPSLAFTDNAQLIPETLRILNQLSSIDHFKSLKEMEMMRDRLDNILNLEETLKKSEQTHKNLSIYFHAVVLDLSAFITFKCPETVSHLMETKQINANRSLFMLNKCYDLAGPLGNVYAYAIANYVRNTDPDKISNSKNRDFAWNQIDKWLRNINDEAYEKLKESAFRETDQKIKENANIILEKIKDLQMSK